MPHTYNQMIVHVVFSTKERRPLIKEPKKMWAYMAGICRNIHVESLAIGGMPDHTHLLINIPTDVAMAKVVNQLKSNSSKWAKAGNPLFAWQQGFAAFSVSASNVGAVKDYIRTQEEHHRKRSFEGEFLALLRKHGVPYDLKFVFG